MAMSHGKPSPAGTKRDVKYLVDSRKKASLKNQKLFYSSMKMEVKNLMEADPSVIPVLHSALVDLGKLSAEVGETVLNASPPQSARGMASTGTSKANTPRSSDGGDDFDDRDAPDAGARESLAVVLYKEPAARSVKIGGKLVPEDLPSEIIYFTSLDKPNQAIPGFIVLHIFDCVERGVLSIDATRGLAPGPRRAIPIAPLQEIFEALFDIIPNQRIPDELRGGPLAVVISFLSDLNMKNNRRALNLSFPLDWLTMGCCEYAAAKKEISVKSKLPPFAEMNLKATDLGLADSFDLTKLKLELNYSRHRSFIQEKGGFRNWMVQALFAEFAKKSVKTDGDRSKLDGPPLKSLRIHGKKDMSPKAAPRKQGIAQLLRNTSSSKIFVNEANLIPPPRGETAVSIFAGSSKKLCDAA